MGRRDSISHNGTVYYSVPAAARLLRTNTAKIREEMGAGELDWTQVRLNGRILIPAESLVAYLRRHEPKKG